MCGFAPLACHWFCFLSDVFELLLKFRALAFCNGKTTQPLCFYFVLQVCTFSISKNKTQNAWQDDSSKGKINPSLCNGRRKFFVLSVSFHEKELEFQKQRRSRLHGLQLKTFLSPLLSLFFIYNFILWSSSSLL